MGNCCPCGTHSRPENKYLPDPNKRIANSYSQIETKNIRSDGNGETLDANNRVLPPLPTKKRVRALYNFEAINEGDLSFKKGEVIEIDDETSEAEDWWIATNIKTKKRGYIPSNYVIIDDSSPQAQDWWFKCDRKEADKMLLFAGHPHGTFLVRESRDKKSYALSVRDCNEGNGDAGVKHYRICQMDDDKGYFINARKTFPSMNDLISYYQAYADGLCCKITKPCPRIRPVVQFRELEIKRDNIRLSSKLGSGCFGDVWKGTLSKVVDVAVKTLRPGTMSSEGFLNEAKIMHRLTHRKLVQLLAIVSKEEPFYIITELMINGALLDYLRSEKGKRLPFNTLIDINAQVAEGMSYLESVNFIHRDLRAANILVGEHFEVKVADFGLARILEDEEPYKGQETTKFPIKWTAPEAACKREFSVKSDVWSFGVLMYEIITFGKAPYAGMTGYEVLAKLDRGFRMEKPLRGPLEVPDAYYDMMLKCWHREPKQRPTFESLHNFFEDYNINTESSYRKTDDI